MSLIIMAGPPQDLTGRILALNLEKCRRFQCGGFQLGPNRPFASVPHIASMERLQQALLDGRLLDITDQNIKGVKTDKYQFTPAAEIAGDEHRVFMTVDAHGNLVITAPADAATEARMEAEVASAGVIRIEGEVEVSERPLEGVLEGRIDSATAATRLDHIANAMDQARAQNYKTKFK